MAQLLANSKIGDKQIASSTRRQLFIDGEYKETSSGKTIILRPNKLSIDSKGNLFINEINEV